MKRSIALLPVFLLLAGCQGATTMDHPVDGLPGDVPTPPPGEIQGQALDDEVRPLANLTVLVAETGTTAFTDPDGRFDFPDMPAGNYSVVASNPTYQDASALVEVRPGATTVVNLTLVKLPEFKPRNFTVSFPGKYECAMEAFIIPGSCGILFEFAGQSDPFQAAYDFPFTVDDHWDTILVQATWTEGASSQFDGLRLYLENANDTAEGFHGTQVARVYGNEQPLSIRIDRGVDSDTAEYYEGTNTKAFVNDTGGAEHVRVFPQGKFYDVTKEACLDAFGCFLGFGVGLNVEFTVYVTVFYNGRAPEGFTAVPA